MDENIDNLYSIYFGISCAFFALKLLPNPEISDEKWSEVRNRMLKGNAHLLGLFIWKFQRKIENTEKIKLEIAQKEIKTLRHQIESKDKFINEIQENLKKAENAADGLRENLENEARRHSSEILKHKTVFLELVSSHRRLEADTGRALRRSEAVIKELDLANERLSTEIVKLHGDLEQKDRILMAMLRKSRLDTSEKQRLLKAVKLSGMGNRGSGRIEARFVSDPYLTDGTQKQLRLKDEKLEREITQLKHGNKNLKATLSDSETEFHSLKEQILHLSPPNPHKLNFNTHNTVRSKVKVVKREPGLAIQEMKIKAEDNNSNNNKFNKTNSAHELKSLHKETKREGVEKSTWKMDVHAIGVMYKVKRLKQQLMLLERMKGENNNGITGYYGLMSVLNKQVDRYQSLQVKIDDFCMRMHTITRQEDKTKRLEQFLEQTFQLQRYIVATGQKLMQVQAKITASDFLEDTQHIEQPTSFFDINRLADSLKALFQEVQRGIEVRISRIIGDLEATLTCDGFYIR